MQKRKELARFVYEEKEYIIGCDIFILNNYKIAYPWVMITINSSKKLRKSITKQDAHFLRIKTKNPYSLIKKVLKIYDVFFQDFDYIAFYPYRDDKSKRIKLYEVCLNFLGFEKLYFMDKIYLFKRKNAKPIKRLTIKSIIDYF
jgi:hypothetical protein